MGRSTSSCFKIITCGGDSVNKDDDDDLEPLESKGLTDKRRWSFRKRSTRHRVLSNTVISDTPPSGHKESPESTRSDFHAQSNPSFPEKTSLSHWKDETVPWSTTVNSNVSDPLTVSENFSKTDPFVSTDTAGSSLPLTTTVNAININHTLEESAAIVIQTAIRVYLAQRALLKLKNVVILQAAVRGHLVRRQAVGTLRCVQAIVKMQVLLRARRARMSLHESVTEKKIDGRHAKSSWSMKPSGKENYGKEGNRDYSCTEKLLSNGFARQLLESTQLEKQKQIHIKCDPSKPDSAWKWLERWMSVSSDSQAQKVQASPEFEEQGEKITTVAEGGFGIPAEVVSVPGASKSTVIETETPLGGEENLITHDADNFDFQVCGPTPSMSDDMEQPHFGGLSKNHETCSTMYMTQMDTKPDPASYKLPVPFSGRPEVDNEQPRRSVKRMASEQPENEGKKFVFVSRKACNPAFTAVQSKFEELSSSVISNKSNNCSQGTGLELKLDNVSSSGNSVTRIKELSLAENSISHEPRVRVGGSECGTELSISSTLDSPDRSEVGREDFEHETEVTERMSCELNGATNASILENLDIEAKNSSSNSDSNLPNTISQHGKLEVVKGDSVEPVVSEDILLDQQPERSVWDVQNQLDAPADHQTYRYSPEGSPTSHVTVPESHGTPSSQVSVKAKRNKLDKSGSGQKRKSLSAGKRSPSNPNRNSDARSSVELLPRDSNNGKRRNSFGSTRPDHAEQEPRDSSSNSLPSYMQATESARAKAHANNSPKSSPDVQDKDVTIKKRHSLPGANGKQVSPRMQRSMSQVQQGAKGEGRHNNERKWQR